MDLWETKWTYGKPNGPMGSSMDLWKTRWTCGKLNGPVGYIRTSHRFIGFPTGPFREQMWCPNDAPSVHINPHGHVPDPEQFQSEPKAFSNKILSNSESCVCYNFISLNLRTRHEQSNQDSPNGAHLEALLAADAIRFRWVIRVEVEELALH